MANMTTYNSLKREAERQSARLAFTLDPFAQRILRSSINDIVEAMKAYPHNLIWVSAGAKG